MPQSFSYLEDAYDAFLASKPSVIADRLTDALALASDREATMAAQMGLACDSRATPGKKAFLKACADGNAPLVAALLQEGVPVDEVDPEGRSGLMLVAMGRHEGTAAMLLAASADIELVDVDGCNALHTVAETLGSSESAYLSRDECGARLVERFVNGDCDSAALEARNGDGLTPLGSAICHGNVDVARALIEAGSDVDAADCRGNGCTPLMLCFIGGFITHLPEESSAGELTRRRAVQQELVEALLEARADVPGTRDAMGFTALDYASECPELCRLLHESKQGVDDASSDDASSDDVVVEATNRRLEDIDD